MKIKYLIVFLFLALCFAVRAEGDYGVNIHVMWEHKEVPREFQMLNGAGIRFIRSDFSWRQQEQKPGVWNFERHDAAIREAEKYGHTILPIIGYAPDWGKPAHEKLDLWLASVEKNLDRYGAKLKYWEIWNEHNYKLFWENPNPHDYLKLLKPTAELIRRKYSDVKIVLGGTSQIPMEYLETLLKEGAGAYFDVMNIHPYSWYDIPEVELEKQIGDLRAMMRKYGAGEKEIWITEIGWPTDAEHTYLQEFLPGALRAAGIGPEHLRLAVLDDNKIPLVASSPGMDFRRILPEAERIQSITLDELQSLDPKEFPVLIAASGESFSPEARDVDALAAYVKRGGLAVFPRGIPFYTALRRSEAGVWGRGWIDQSFRSKLRFDFDAWWLDRSKPMPKSFTGRVPETLAGKLKLTRNVSTHSVIVPRGFKGNDRLVTLVEGVGEGMSGPLAAYIKFDSDFRGGLIVTTFNWVGAAPVGETMQAELLPRTILTALKAGAARVFWYEFQAMENDPHDSEHYFGIVHRDLTPKPAWEAYRTLAAMRPSGSTRPEETFADGVRMLSWTKPDGEKVWALYVTGARRKVKLALAGKCTDARDLLGNAVSLEAGNGEAEITLSPGLLYLAGPEKIELRKRDR